MNRYIRDDSLARHFTSQDVEKLGYGVSKSFNLLSACSHEYSAFTETLFSSIQLHEDKNFTSIAEKYKDAWKLLNEMVIPNGQNIFVERALAPLYQLHLSSQSNLANELQASLTRSSIQKEDIERGGGSQSSAMDEKCNRLFSTFLLVLVRLHLLQIDIY